MTDLRDFQWLITNRGKAAKARYLHRQWAGRAIDFMCSSFYEEFLRILNTKSGYGILWMDYIAKVGWIWEVCCGHNPYNTERAKDLLNHTIRMLLKFGFVADREREAKCTH